jgi:mannose-6-phosphate isomerase-like protein (cupin superfamily)
MTYPGETGEISARYRPSAEVPPLMFASGTNTRFVAPGSATDGQFGLFEWNFAEEPGGPSPHFHKTFSESFYILDGAVRLFDGRTWVDATKGDFLYVPEGGIHAFRNENGAASMLILFSPGPARETYFEELVAIRESGRQLSYDEWTEVYARHDQYRA